MRPVIASSDNPPSAPPSTTNSLPSFLNQRADVLALRITGLLLLILAGGLMTFAVLLKQKVTKVDLPSDKSTLPILPNTSLVSAFVGVIILSIASYKNRQIYRPPEIDA